MLNIKPSLNHCMAALSIMLVTLSSSAFARPSNDSIDALIMQYMQQEDVPGVALAVIENGKVTYRQTYGYRDVEAKAPLNADTVMYGASLTKFLFSVFVMQLVEEGKLDLDLSIAELLSRPLPDYENFSDLAGDGRWRALTLRGLLGHTSGLPNFRFFPPEGGYDPNGKLQFFYDPGERYGYSGEGYYIAQLVVEEALGIETGRALQERFFDPLGMSRTSLIWRDDFRPNFAQGYSVDGENMGHNMQSNVRAAGSMDTTLNDFSRWVAAFMSGMLLGQDTLDDMFSPIIYITTPHQFPTLDNGFDPRIAEASLAAGVGAETWQGPQGQGFAKGGHNEKTDNMLACIVSSRTCVLLLSNTAKGHLMFPQIIEYIIGPTGMPWRWKYSGMKE